MSPRRREEGRGTHGMFVTAAALAVILVAAVTVWPFLPDLENPPPGPPGPATDMHSSQPEGESTVGQDTSPPTADDPAPRPGDAGRRAPQIGGSAEQPMELTPEQRQAIRTYIAQQSRQATPERAFTIAVGAAVPRQVPLEDLRGELARALPAYRGNQYIVIGDQLVIVERDSRRIVAIIPAAG